MASRVFLVCLALCVTGGFVPHSVSAATAAAPIVDLGYAQYQGTVDVTLNITTYRGLRYAAPPTGKTQFPHTRTGSLTNLMNFFI